MTTVEYSALRLEVGDLSILPRARKITLVWTGETLSCAETFRTMQKLESRSAPTDG